MKHDAPSFLHETPTAPPPAWPTVRDAFVVALRAAGNPIADSPMLLAQTIGQARRVVATLVPGPDSDPADDLTDDPVDDPTDDPVDDDRADEDASRAIGAARALSKVHPLHSVRAAGVLFDVILPVVLARRAASGAEGEIPAIASRLHRLVMEGIGAAALYYVDTLFLELHNSRVDERRRISRELHDEVAHSMGRALYAVEDRGPGATTDAARQRIQEALDDVRRLSGELRPAVDPAGLETALRRYIDDHGLEDRVTVMVSGDSARVPPSYGEEIYFTLREALRNAITHAEGAPVEIEIHVGADTLSARVTDRGPGVGARPSAPGRGQGLLSMRERVELLRGEFSMTSRPHHGTCVSIEIPLLGLPS